MDDDAEALRIRIAELEAENEGLRSPKRRRITTRGVFAVIVLTLCVILAPVVVLGTWTRLELVDTDRFVATFAPLADKPEVQTFVASQAMDAINQNVDIDGAIDDLFNGLSGLGLPPRANAVLPMLKRPVENGVESIISTTVTNFVRSPAFARIWDTALRETHTAAIAALRGHSGGALTLADDGTITLQLGTVINRVVEQVKANLGDSGISIADSIPTINKTIPLADGSGFKTIQTVYRVATAAGYVLPWVLLALLVLGIGLARHRIRALGFTAAGLAVSLGIVALALAISRRLFIDAVSPSPMPSDTASVMFDQVTEFLVSAIAAMILLSVLVVAGSWFAGNSTYAVSVRRTLDDIFSAARTFADGNGLSTGRFGRFLDEWRGAIVLILVGIGFAWIFYTRPVNFGAVAGSLIFLLCGLVLLELLRRPAKTIEAELPT